MVQTLEYWNPATGNYALVAPGILVLTDDTNWNVLNQNTGMYVPAAFPATFRQMVHEGLTCLNQTFTGQVILAGIAAAAHAVDVTPTSLGNNVQSVNQPQAVNTVAAELLANGIPGGATAAALTVGNIGQGARSQFLRYAINQSPRWQLDGVPGAGNSWWTTLESTRQWANRWVLLLNPFTFHWSDSNEGYFNNQTYLPRFTGDVYDIGLTNHEAAAWLGGQPLPMRLTPAQREHAINATITALSRWATASGGSAAHVRWNPYPSNPLNAYRPPIIGLAHELMHAYFSVRGEQCGYDDGHFSTVLFEYRCVGLGPWDEVAPSENAIRSQWATGQLHIPVNGANAELNTFYGQNRRMAPKRTVYNTAA